MRGWDKDIVNTCTIDECAAKIQSSIIKAYEKSCPLKTASGVQNTPYWSSELGNLRKTARKAWNHRLTDPEAYKNAIKEYTKALRSKKRPPWKDFCGKVDGKEPSARLHRILSKDDDYKMGAFRLPSGAFTSTDQEVAEHLLETHFPGCQPISGPQSQSQPITPSTEDWLIASSVITEEKIIWAVNRFGSYKTAGEDGVFPGLLQQGT
jgi:hypothetical protein